MFFCGKKLNERELQTFEEIKENYTESNTKRQQMKLYPIDYFTYTAFKKSNFNNNLAYSFAKDKLFKEALQRSNLSIEFNPFNHAAYDTRGFIKYYLVDFDNSLKDINKSIKLDPNHPVKFFHRGFANEKLGNIEKAIKDWEKASELGYCEAEITLKKYKAVNHDK